MEQQLIDLALYYEKNSKPQESSTSGKNVSWYRAIHEHFNKITLPHIQKQHEHFVEYWPVKFSFGENASYKQGLSSGKLYRSTSGTFGTGYISFSDKNIYISALSALTKEYPLYKKSFMDDLFDGLQGQMNDREPYKGDKTWAIEYPSLVGAQITQSDGSDVIFLKTTTLDWYIHEHFIDTLPNILNAIKMGYSGKLASIWVKPAANKAEALDLLEKLNVLRTTGIITEAEFEQKKRKLLDQI
jgi:hypothetical protein